MKCKHCVDGYVTLLTSRVPCEHCTKLKCPDSNLGKAEFYDQALGTQSERRVHRLGKPVDHKISTAGDVLESDVRIKPRPIRPLQHFSRVCRNTTLSPGDFVFRTDQGTCESLGTTFAALLCAERLVPIIRRDSIEQTPEFLFHKQGFGFGSLVLSDAEEQESFRSLIGKGVAFAVRYCDYSQRYIATCSLEPSNWIDSWKDSPHVADAIMKFKHNH